VLPSLLLQAIQTVCATSSPGTHRIVARFIASLQYALSRSRRSAVLENLAQIAASGHPGLTSPRERARAAKSMFESLQLSWIEYFAELPGRNERRDLAPRFRGTELLYRALARGRGAVIAAPHVGSWELAGLALARLGLEVHAVSGVQIHPLLARSLRDRKARQGIVIRTPAEGFAPLVAALRQGAVVILLVDGDIHSRSLPAPFFGRAIPFPAGPAILARRARVPILHAHATRGENGRHEISFDGLDEPDPGLGFAEDLARLTTLVARSQERTIAANVTQWCIFRPLWNAADAA
jgi:phosphatidylinositol dimannoside acyltransferase